MAENFVRLAKEFRADSAAMADRPDYRVRDIPESPEGQQAFLDKMRPELYALSAIVIDRVMTRVVRDESRHCHPQRAALLLKGSALGAFTDGADRIASALRNDLSLHTNQEISHRNHTSDPITQRLSDLCYMFNLMSSAGQYWSVERLIAAGSATGARAIQHGLRAVPKTVHEAKPGCSNEQVAAIARHSHGMISRIAGVNIQHLDSAVELLSTEDFSNTLLMRDTSPLALFSDEAGAQRVDLVKPVTEQERRFIGKPEHKTIGDIPTYHPTLGCPARVRLGRGEDSAITRLWNMAVDTAEAMELFAEPCKQEFTEEIAS